MVLCFFLNDTSFSLVPLHQRVLLRPAILFALLLEIAGGTRLLSAQTNRPMEGVLSRTSNPSGPFARLAGPVVLHPDSIVEVSRALLGVRYQWAGSSPDRGMDCSGLVKFVLAHFGVSLPHSSAMMARLGLPVAHDSSEIRPGDLLFFSKPRSTRISHVAIYSGDGRIVHASPGQRKVVETPLRSLGRSVVLRHVRRLADSVSTSGE